MSRSPETAPPGREHVSPPQPPPAPAPPTPPPPSTASSSVPVERVMSRSPETAPPGWEHVSPPQPPTPPPPLAASASLPELGQMVCGSCHELLSYPIRAKRVQCPCCQTVNFVLEAHQVGIVNCGKCSVLLMYPYEAPCVRCSACRIVTEIGAHNRRPPVSVLQGHHPAPGNPVS